MFRFQDDKLVNIKSGYAIDSGKLDTEGARVSAQVKRNTPQQKWTILYVDQSKPMQKTGMNKEYGFFINRAFNIVSKLPMGRVLDVQAKGLGLVIRRRVLNDKSQSFYFDGSTKTILSTKHKGLAITIGGEGKSSVLSLAKNGARWFQMFKIKGDFITNEKGNVLDVQGGKDQENRIVQAYKLNKSVAQ
jgi:Fe2+ transport system protein FeoA